MLNSITLNGIIKLFCTILKDVILYNARKEPYIILKILTLYNIVDNFALD